MYKGYLGYGSEPLVNLARLAKYAAEGAIPRDVELVLPEVSDYDDLAAALGEDAYRTPLLDGAPWYDATNPDSAYFAGILPIDVTGLDGSTRTRTVTEGLADGGTANRGRATTKTIAVSAYALGATQAALDAGLSWLAGALHPPCADAGSCGGTRLDLFASAPTYCDELPDLDADPIVTLLIGAPLAATGPTLAYVDVEGGALLDPTCGEVTVTAVVGIGDSITGEDLTGRTVVLSLVDSTGNPYAETGAVILPADKSTVTLTLTVEPSPGFPAQWQPLLSWYGPAVLDGGDSTSVHDLVYSVDGGGAVPLPDLYDGGDSDGPWSVGAGYGGNLAVTSWSYTRQPFLTTEECLTSIRRSYRKVVTLDGPTVVEELTGNDGAPFAAKVEWTWSATDPVVYGDVTDLLGGLIVGRKTGSSHPAVRVASTTDVPLFVPPTIVNAGIDGVVYANSILHALPVLQPGDRVLLKNQTHTPDNGIWVYHGRGAYLTRATDMDTWGEVVAAEVYVTAGNTQAATTWHTTSVGGGTLNTTPIVWAAGGGGGSSFYDNGITTRAAGIQIADNADVAGVDTACPLPAPTLVLCGTDPTLPDLTSPPAPPTLADPGMPSVTTYTRRAIQLPPELSPQPGGALTLVVRNLAGIAYRGIRVRLWADPDPDFGVADECAFQSETYLTYLAGGQTVTIDGPEHTVTTTCDTGIDADHEPSMRGPYGGPFTFPELTCGSRYHLTIDVPVTADAGGVSVDLSVTRRGV